MKNFLDEDPQDWTNESYRQLQEKLVFYADVTGVAELQSLARRAGIKAGTFPDRDNLHSTAEALIREMGRQKLLRKLVETAAEDETSYKKDLGVFKMN